MTRTPFTSDKTPPPAGTYSVAMEAGGLVFLAGQTPRDRDNVRHGDKPFAVQARMTLDNLEAAANAAGLSLKDAVRVGVFLRNPCGREGIRRDLPGVRVGAVPRSNADAVELRRVRHRGRRRFRTALKPASSLGGTVLPVLEAVEEERTVTAPRGRTSRRLFHGQARLQLFYPIDDHGHGRHGRVVEAPAASLSIRKRWPSFETS